MIRIIYLFIKIPFSSEKAEGLRQDATKPDHLHLHIPDKDSRTFDYPKKKDRQYKQNVCSLKTSSILMGNDRQKTGEKKIEIKK